MPDEPQLDADDLRFILGLKARRLRHESGLGLKEIAGRAGLSVSYLSEIEKGKKHPKPGKLLRLAEALGTTYEELVSPKVGDDLDPVRSLFASPFLREFPFGLFGVEPESLLGLLTDAPEKAGALVRAFVEVARTYDVRVEHFLLAALRAYQQMNANHFPDLEREAASFRAARGLEPGHAVEPDALASVLVESWGYEIDSATLPGDPDLAGFRSVYREGPPPTLYVNGRLLPTQRAFILAREIGYRHLGLEERALSSSWLEVESFEQVLNNFRASYFAGAVVIDRESLEDRLRELFARPRWDGEALVACMGSYGATPEMFLHRLTELAHEVFGLTELFFMRFNNAAGGETFDLTKVFNLSRVPVPHGIGLHEHYCRRWPAMRLLGELARRPGAAAAGRPAVAAQRSRFIEEAAEFFVISMARPLALAEATHSGVTIGFLLDDAFKAGVGFWDDPAIPRVEVNLTCERCRLDDCAERVAEPAIFLHEAAQERKRRALATLIEGAS